MQNKNSQKYVLKECKNYYHFLKKKVSFQKLQFSDSKGNKLSIDSDEVIK